MDIEDLELFIKARHQSTIPTVLFIISLLLFLCFFFMAMAEFDQKILLQIFTIAMALLITACGKGKWSFVSREALLDIIEKQVNSDSHAIEYVSGKIHPEKAGEKLSNSGQ